MEFGKANPSLQTRKQQNFGDMFCWIHDDHPDHHHLCCKIHKEYINRKKEFVGFCGRASFFKWCDEPCKNFLLFQRKTSMKHTHTHTHTHTHKLRKKLDDFIISQKKVPRFSPPRFSAKWTQPNKLQQPNPPAHQEGWMAGWMEKHFFIGFKFPS
jgi:hypothetical protein